MTQALDWNDFRFFLELARSGKLAVTAKRLGVEHTTVARHVTQLEKRLDCSLFNRRRNGYALTEIGETFVPHAEAMEAAMLVALSDHCMKSEGISGTVRIGTPEGVGMCVVLPRLAKFCDDNPELKIELLPMPHFPNLAAREVDILITLERPQTGRLVVSRYSKLHYQLFGSLDYLARHEPIKSREDLAAQEFVDYVQDVLMSDSLAYLEKLTPHPQRRFTSTSMLAQRDAALAGLGLAMLTPYVAGQRADLIPVLPEETRIALELWIAAPTDLFRLHRVRSVWNFLRNIVETEPELFVFDPA